MSFGLMLKLGEESAMRQTATHESHCRDAPQNGRRIEERVVWQDPPGFCKVVA
jgi:hypothetical protein